MWACGIAPPYVQQSYFFLFVFLICKRFACFGTLQYLVKKNIEFFVYYFRTKSIATTRNCRLLGPWSVRVVAP